MTDTKTVLYVCHNHPSVRPGGAENYAYELFESFAGSGASYEPVFLAKGGPPLGHSDNPHAGVYVAPVGKRADDYFFFTDGYSYDWLNGTITDKDYYTVHFRKFLEAIRPDVVHFQHTLFLGYDVLRLVRDTLPDAAIVYTLHEYAPICHRDGQMLRTREDELCSESSPRRCHECFPDISPQQFFLRRTFIQSHLALVDMFVAPSRFLLERYVEWGIPRERILFEENGRVLPDRPAPAREADFRDRFAFFGQISPYKGLDVALEAMRILRDQVGGSRGLLDRLRLDVVPEPIPSPQLYVHGANLELQPGPHQDRIRALVAAAGESVTMMGRYQHRHLARLIADVDWVVIPSIWWENSPLVIQEAFVHGRPIICSDIGGMAEKVEDGVNGMHFRARDPRHLAEVMRLAASEPERWEKLRAGIPPVHSVEDHRDRLCALYDDLLHRRTKEHATDVA